MFTVILCSKELYESCTVKYREFLAPLLQPGEYAFCRWNPEGKTLEEAVPQLHETISGYQKWRALLVLDRELYGTDQICKRNPYDYVDVRDRLKELCTSEDIFSFREVWEQRLQKAVANPLMRLGMWLAGSSSSEYPATPESYASLPEVEDEAYFEELCRRGLCAAEVEWDRLTEKRGQVLSENFCLEGQLSNKPSQLLVLCERMLVNENEACRTAWQTDQEHAYSSFFEDNLYSSRMRCLVSDVAYVNASRSESDYFRFLTLVMLLARNDTDEVELRHGRLYQVGVRINRDKISDCYYAYLGKLQATLRSIQLTHRRTQWQDDEPMSEEEMSKRFLSDVTVPVRIPGEFDREALMCSWDGLGLSRDCPGEEYDYWYGQHHEIEKKFVRYLREPRRAVRSAAETDLRQMNAIDDDRTTSLTPTQLEEVNIRLLDEEEKMVKTRTMQLFRTEAYTQLLDEADEQIRRGISQRMTKKKTVLTALIALAAFLIGFLPMLFGGIRSVKSAGVSLLLTGVCLGLLAVTGFVFVLILRKRLVDRFKHFNYVMQGILQDIDEGLRRFCVYFSHLCNVMREFSVLNVFHSTRTNRYRILKKHEHLVLRQLQKAHDVFAGCILQRKPISIRDCEPYPYDYLQDQDYDYEMQSLMRPGKVAFMSESNLVSAPVDYIEAVTLKREELYD